MGIEICAERDSEKTPITPILQPKLCSKFIPVSDEEFHVIHNVLVGAYRTLRDSDNEPVEMLTKDHYKEKILYER